MFRGMYLAMTGESAAGLDTIRGKPAKSTLYKRKHTTIRVVSLLDY